MESRIPKPILLGLATVAMSVAFANSPDGSPTYLDLVSGNDGGVFKENGTPEVMSGRSYEPDDFSRFRTPFADKNRIRLV